MLKSTLTTCLLLILLSMTAQTLQLLPTNPHYFEYRDRPTVIIGSGEHYGAVLNLDFDYDLYLETLRNDRLNHTRLFTGAYYERPGAFGIEHNTLAPAEDKLILPWRKVGDKYDLTQWNEDFFTRLKDFMAKAERAGVIVEATLFSSYYGAGWPYHPFHGNNNRNGTPTDLSPKLAHTLDNGSLLQHQEAYVRRLVRELNAFDNLYFEIQNEPWAESSDTVLVWNDYLSRDELKQAGNFWRATMEVPSEASRDWHRTVSGWIVDEEKALPKKHLISHNIANFKQPVYLSDPNISIYNFHYALPEAMQLNYHVGKAIGCNETGFAGRDGEVYRRQAWRFLFSGGGLFSHLDYSFTVGHEAGTDTTQQAPGAGSPGLRRYLAILKNYVEGLHLPTLRPDAAWLRHVEGAFPYAMRDGGQYVVYLEPLLPSPITVNLALPPGRYRCAWTDVRTGEALAEEELTVEKGKASLKSPTGTGDKVLKITPL